MCRALKVSGIPVRREGMPRAEGRDAPYGGKGLTVTAMRPATAHLPPSGTPDSQVRTEKDLEGVAEGVEALSCLVGKMKRGPTGRWRWEASGEAQRDREEGCLTAQPSRPRRRWKTEGRLL